MWLIGFSSYGVDVVLVVCCSWLVVLVIVVLCGGNVLSVV